ncbi:MAG: family 43 glycosylhydrolase [Verrucomicrobia bacterium]|nr:family 43 glycosylhydrolase [Verrucomicrobiota bacterium]MCG2680857.1 family 43 glycosylhydrolase [Kiritimatiellia bacterium]MBU4246867.1 family 43 glycosylhydrolase [Verrucomicrobiota bacterium]MBU4290387.1 family 43 glycosylhydrolase [Verrucomicrobiota bacterium]MBU4430238.1 family 43 glycosylhydrolase [Verrucomicrobiota bacterium]
MRKITITTRTAQQTLSGWVKYKGNPVLGGQYGTCFDVSVLKDGDLYRMWVSWRPKASVALVESRDGLNWSAPEVVLGPNKKSGWEENINRPVILKKDTTYHMWYTGQTKDRSWIGYATSPDGVSWKRMSDNPVLSPETTWEKAAVMCPHVIWDEQDSLWKMWYSSGEQYEPDAIGHATSKDGLRWNKYKANPIFMPEPENEWEKCKVTACQVEKRTGWYIMFYIGFRDVHYAQIGLARSRNGLSHWQRHSQNPILSPAEGHWDADACYKPCAIYDEELGLWKLWYNGRREKLEQIGLATHRGERLWPELRTGDIKSGRGE